MRRPMVLVRRLAVLALPGLLLGFCLRVGDAPAQLAPRKLTTTEAAAHVWSRLAFGARPGQVKTLAETGWKNWVEQQLSPDSIDDSQVTKVLAERCPSLSLSRGELYEQSRENRKERGKLKDDLREAILLRAVSSKKQFQEVMIDFWRNHLNVDVNKVPGLATHYEEHVLRRHAFGKFADLLLASARHPAMLVYLDNFVSNKNGLNENYAREVMELHTLGVDNGYSQQDVIALAKVLTGWTCGWRTGRDGQRDYRFYFDLDKHIMEPVSVVGLELNGFFGVGDGERALRHLAAHERTARFISTKLCRHLVNDTPAPQLIDRVTEVYLRTDGDLREVYRAIIFSSDFWDVKNYRAKFKTPFEFTISTLRTMSARIESPQQIFRELQLMGQPLYECEEPTGWSDGQEAWLDPGVMVYRWNFAIKLVKDEIKGVKVGTAFIDELTKVSPAGRPRKVMELVLPGVTDTRTHWLASHTTDVRAMVAWALGSPSFMQQ